MSEGHSGRDTGPDEPDFLDIMDQWDEPVHYDDVDDESPFVPMYAQPWFKVLSVIVAISMAALLIFYGISSFG